MNADELRPRPVEELDLFAVLRSMLDKVSEMVPRDSRYTEDGRTNALAAIERSRQELAAVLLPPRVPGLTPVKLH
jgi:hypothetical protein